MQIPAGKGPRLPWQREPEIDREDAVHGGSSGRPAREEKRWRQSVWAWAECTCGQSFRMPAVPWTSVLHPHAVYSPIHASAGRGPAQRSPPPPPPPPPRPRPFLFKGQTQNPLARGACLADRLSPHSHSSSSSALSSSVVAITNHELDDDAHTPIGVHGINVSWWSGTQVREDKPDWPGHGDRASREL